MYKNVLVPLDGSELAECSLSHVKNLVSHEAIGEVTLLSVVLTNFDWYQIDEGFDHSAFRNNLLKQSRQYLADIQSRLAVEGINVKTESVEGSVPAQVIADYSKNNGMDMIVMSTHGRTGLRHLMFGSVALSVLHESHVPVLLIRPEACRM
jgi:nucleotide-binding universal stress UspA family protein